jgi:hypothetical protein
VHRGKEAALFQPSRLRLFYLLRLSQPKSDRLIFREIRRAGSQRILEIGIGLAQRATRMLQVASVKHATRDLQYTGIDLFEGRTEADGPGLSLREAYRTLKATDARIQLVPGTPDEALTRVANGLTNLDLIVVSSRTPIDQLNALVRYLPRMIHANTLIYQESRDAAGATSVRRVTMAEIADLVDRSADRAA